MDSMDGTMSAGDQLHSEGDGEEKTQQDTYFLPQGVIPEGMKVNPGDVLEFKVVGQSDKGEIEVSYHTGDDKEGGMDWRDEMRQNVKKEGSY
jgi:hypothetical protein